MHHLVTEFIHWRQNKTFLVLLVLLVKRAPKSPIAAIDDLGVFSINSTNWFLVQIFTNSTNSSSGMIFTNGSYCWFGPFFSQIAPIAAIGDWHCNSPIAPIAPIAAIGDWYRYSPIAPIADIGDWYRYSPLQVFTNSTNHYFNVQQWCFILALIVRE